MTIFPDTVSIFDAFILINAVLSFVAAGWFAYAYWRTRSWQRWIFLWIGILQSFVMAVYFGRWTDYITQFDMAIWLRLVHGTSALSFIILGDMAVTAICIINQQRLTIAAQAEVIEQSRKANHD